MTIQQKLKDVHANLSKWSIGCDKVKHYWHDRLTAPYVLWAEDGPEDYFDGDNRHGEYTAHCTLDLFTRTEFDPVFDEIEEMLNDMFGSRWRWKSTQYEDGTKLIHHEWEFVV